MPLSLRCTLLAATACALAWFCSPAAEAATLHADVSIQTHTGGQADFTLTTPIKLAGGSSVELTGSSGTSGSAYTFSGEMELVSGQTTITSGKAALTAAGSSVKSATVAKGASLKLSGTAGLTVAEAVHMGNKSTPAVAAFSLFSAPTVSEEATLENVAVTASSMAAASAGTCGVVSDAAISIAAADAFSLSGLDLLNSDLQVQSTSLSLSDVVLGAGSTLVGQGADATAVLLEQVTLALSSNACTLVDGSLYGAAYAGKTVGIYTVETFRNVSLSGLALRRRRR